MAAPASSSGDGYDDDDEFDIDGYMDEFDLFDIFIGSKPSQSVLSIIEAAFPIAVWSRDGSLDLRQELDEAQWKDWPEQIRALRKRQKDANITLFWDDLYPKPSERSRPLNPSVVE